MNSIAYLILLQINFGAPDALALDNGAIRIELDAELFAIRFLGRPGGENFLDPIFVRDSVRTGEGLVESGGLTTSVEPIEFRAAPLSRGPARPIDSGPYHIVLIGPVAEESGLRLRKEVRIDPKEPKAWFTVTVLSLNKEAVTVSLLNSARLPMGTTVSVRESEAALIHALQEGIGRLPFEDAGEGFSMATLSPRATPLEGSWGGRAGGAILKNATGAWVRKFDGALADAPAYIDEASLVVSIDDGAKRYSVNLRSGRAQVDSASPLILREVWELEWSVGGSPADE